MSKIVRYAGNLRAFGSEAQGMERTLFGETTQADDLTSQVTASFLRGWGIVGPSENPSLEDFNAAMYAMSQFIAYQHQMGVPEWDAAQEYYAGSVCVRSGELYISQSDSNIGSAPPSAKWTLALTSKNASFLKTANNLSEISLSGTSSQLAARTNLGLEAVIGQLANGGTFASCNSNGYYLVTITDPTSVSDMPKFNGVYASGNGFLFVKKSETSISQVYITSNGGTCSRFKLGSGSFSAWDFKYSATYTPTITNLGIGDVGTGQTWRAFDSTQRVNNVNYTNTSGRPIMVSVTAGTASTSRLMVDGINMSNTIISGSSGGGLFVGSVIVPIGSVYQLNSSAPAASWAELR